MEDNTSIEVLSAAKETLLRGLSEENQGLQSVPPIFPFYVFYMQSSVSLYLVFHFYFFQTVCSELLESREAPPYCDPGANDDCAAFAVLQSHRKVFPEHSYQSAVGNDKPESRLQEKHLWVPAIRMYFPGQLKSAALFLSGGFLVVCASLMSVPLSRTMSLIPTGASGTQWWLPCLWKPKALRALRV